MNVYESKIQQPWLAQTYSGIVNFCQLNCKPSLGENVGLYFCEARLSYLMKFHRKNVIRRKILEAVNYL